MKKTIAAAVAVTTALALAACGGDTKASSSDGGLTGEPVVLGVQSLDTGPVAYPQNTYGAKAAEWYINNKLGGIGGRPVKLDICSGDGTPETGVKCANDFVAADVPVVFDAYDGTSMGAMTPILKSAGIPIVGTLAGQAVAEGAQYPAAFYFSGPLETSALGMVKILSRLGKKKASLAVTDAPSSHASAPRSPATGSSGRDALAPAATRASSSRCRRTARSSRSTARATSTWSRRRSADGPLGPPLRGTGTARRCRGVILFMTSLSSRMRTLRG